ncbi:MAG: purine-binding chemotaxis protein CheW [Deltaproteobacteria bacterium]|nr:purine-binding chemotaxis protein CheW [Deltaproteobacteria bacterium]
MIRHHFLVFFVGELKFALRLEFVERVVHAVEITPLPGASSDFLGVINVHGSIVPVVNFRARLGLASREIRLDDRLLLVHGAEKTWAFAVDAVAGVIEPPPSEILSAGSIVPSDAAVEGLIRLPDGVLLIGDLERLFPGEAA